MADDPSDLKDKLEQSRRELRETLDARYGELRDRIEAGQQDLRELISKTKDAFETKINAVVKDVTSVQAMIKSTALIGTAIALVAAFLRALGMYRIGSDLIEFP